MMSRARKTAFAVTSTVLAMAGVLATAGSASASTYSRTSPKGGYGVAEVSATRSFYACDMGSADGYRVIAHLWPDGYGYRWAQDANGSNNGCGTPVQLSLPVGTDYTIRVCLRAGSDGADVYCSRDERGTILS
ncbi:hypothetical protein LUX05_09375 [Streptomyces somaliensis]|nr:hypothetical protein [Streptomyces somaliensis]